MTENLDCQSFTQCLNSDFDVLTGSESLPLRLVNVAERTDQPHLEHFSLTFLGPLSPWLPQQTCTLRHPQLGDITLFLVPLGPAADGMRYEAVFNRLRPAPADNA